MGFLAQVLTAIVAPPLIVAAKKATGKLKGKAGFWANIGINVATAAATVYGLGAPAVTTLTVGTAMGLGGSKIHDVVKRGVDPRVH